LWKTVNQIHGQVVAGRVFSCPFAFLGRARALGGYRYQYG
jgi:hypothetical protein